ncbi:hypothetical protein [Amycolatopsis sp. NPDC051071]|uniref:hypothetical protein n=1 Tax=Amycolatopsis sp. NPDC051071 TaxID=3154637 RepID=UPI003447FB0B
MRSDHDETPAGTVPIACIHAQTAHQRARELLDASGAEQFWVESALSLVRCYLMAAAIRGAEVAIAVSSSTVPDHAEPLRSRPDVVPDGWLTS